MVEALEVKKAPFVIEWRDGFKIGIAQVDQEHRHLFTLVRALHLASVDQTVPPACRWFTSRPHPSDFSLDFLVAAPGGRHQGVHHQHTGPRVSRKT
jgi:hypothetical protein